MVQKVYESGRERRNYYLCECGYYFSVSAHIEQKFYDEDGNKYKQSLRQMKCPECGVPFGNVGPTEKEIAEEQERRRIAKLSYGDMLYMVTKKILERNSGD